MIRAPSSGLLELLHDLRSDRGLEHYVGVDEDDELPRLGSALLRWAALLSGVTTRSAPAASARSACRPSTLSTTTTSTLA